MIHDEVQAKLLVVEQLEKRTSQMEAHDVVVAFLSMFLFVGVFFGLFALRRDYEIDSFRQELFKLRDELFDYADAGYVSFDSLAYQQLRDLVNGLIRFAHRLTIWRLLILFSVDHLLRIKHRGNFSATLEKNLADIDSHEVASKMVDFHRRTVQLIAWQVTRSSFLVWPVIIVSLLRQIVHRARLSVARLDAIKDTAEFPAVQRVIPTTWIEEQAIGCA